MTVLPISGPVFAMHMTWANINFYKLLHVNKINICYPRNATASSNVLVSISDEEAKY